MSFQPFGRRVVKVRAIETGDGDARIYSGSGFPKSGTAGTEVSATPGSLYIDVTSDVVFVNEGSQGSPYWTPVSFDQRGLFGFHADFRDGAGKALSNTDATATIPGSGLRVHGQGVAETDSGLVVSMSDQGALGRITTTDEDEHTLTLSFGTGTTPLFQPDQNGTIVVDASIAHVSAITLRGLFFGVCGSAADALDPLINGATTTISFANSIADDIAGLCFDVGLTDADGLFAVKDKGNANASIETTATGVDIGVTVAAAGTFQRLRVEVDADGAVRMFVDKALEATFAAGTLDTDEEIHPVLQLISESTAVKSLDVKHFSAWGKRA
jgi:hypothetical protein